MDRQTMAIEVKKALSETVLLSDGKYGYIITELHDSYGHDKWECHVCQRVISTERAMLMHLSHPLHMNKLRAPHHPTENFRKKTEGKKNGDKKKDDKKPWESDDTVLPGEPIPPGMEDVVKKVCEIQDTLDSHPGPLIGIEYIVELISTEEAVEPKYICLLCEKKGDPRSVMVHLTSHNHALRYISCFFRAAGNALNMIPKVRENRKGLALAVQKVAEEIERHYGRLKPTSAVAETFSQQKYEILRSIDEKEHFRETPTTTFVQYCTLEKIKEFTKTAESEILGMKHKTGDENALPQSSDKHDIITVKTEPDGTKDKKIENSKLSFSIGKPERSFGLNKDLNKPEDKKDDDVIFVGSCENDPIEVQSMSSISSASDDLKLSHQKNRDRRRSRSTSRSRAGRRGRSPGRRRSPRRRSSSPYRDSRYRSRSRSRSRSRGRRYRAHDMRYLPRSGRDPFGRDRRSRSRDRARRRSPYSHKQRPGKSPSPYRPKYKSPEPKKKKVMSEYQAKLDAYRGKLHELEVEMDSKLKYYRERPEKHPQYSDEWKSFWNRRYKELQQSGKDPTGYDFKPEWILYWDERVKQLHEEELACKKEDLKAMLPEEKQGPSNDLQDISPPTPEETKDVTVDDIKNTWKALTGTEIKSPPRARSPSPDTKSPPVGKRSQSPWEDRITGKPWKTGTYVADPPIVHCLRMLAVLENQLGSLGPKALDLLSKAILMEKVKTSESMKLLDDPDVHIFFETVKEKIRGQLIAGIVNRYLVNSCRSLINTTESMLAAHPIKPKLKPTPPSKPSYIQPEPVKVAGVGMVNKMAVAQQIAEVLVAQGRTDVSQQELEELINAVVGIASNSNANVNQSSTSFLSQLNIQNSTADPHINELLSNIISSAQKSTLSSIPPLTNQGFGGTATQEVTGALQVKIPSTSATLQAAQSLTPMMSPVVDNMSLEVPSLSQIPSLLSLPLSTNSKDPSKAYTEAVSAAKATVVEQALSSSINVGKEKQPLFPINEPSTTPLKEISTTEKGDHRSPSKISDDDLRERLMKFKTLSRDEQQSLILLLKELEGNEPERVEKLRKYVTVGLAQNSVHSGLKAEIDSGRLSPFSSRAGGTNPAPEDRKKQFSDLDDDDDDYSVEDIYNTVSQNLKKREVEREPVSKINLDSFDGNSSSSRFSNPTRPSSSPSNSQGKLQDPRTQNPNIPPKSDYNVYSVGNLPSSLQSNSSLYPQTSVPVDNTFKSQYPKAPERDNQWAGSKAWPQGTQDMYSQPGYKGPPSYSTNSYEGSQYSQNTSYKNTSGPYYGNSQQAPYMASQASNKQFSQQYATAPPQPYQGTGVMHNNQPPPHVGNPYNYPRPQEPGQNYYGNYRQY